MQEDRLSIRKGMKGMSHTSIVKTAPFQSEEDLLRLDIIDWDRLHGYWDSSAEAVRAISSWLIGTSIYVVIRCNLYEAPERDDWPGWRHTGRHPEIGRLYWNWFHWRKQGHLFFSDAPDFYGKLQLPDGRLHSFLGDIGRVSPPTFIQAFKSLGAHEFWISVLDPHTQVLIEPLMSICELVADGSSGS